VDHLHQWANEGGHWVCVDPACGVLFENRLTAANNTDTVFRARDDLTPRQLAVLSVLKDGQWHDGPELTHPEVGGSEGLRRLRELRAKGYMIEMRIKAKGKTTRQYRLAR
jgi:hypothetical protein